MPDAAWWNAHFARAEARARAAFRQTLGDGAENAREVEIGFLPRIDFKGRHLVTLRCIRCGSDRNVPRGVAWSLMSLDNYICAWCAVRG